MTAVTARRVAPEGGGALAGTALAVALLSMLSSVLGLLRDTTIAGRFGASGDTDAFLIAWTVPETATPLLMEGAMAFVLVPLFARRLDRDGSLGDVVARTWLPLLLTLLALTGGLVAAAPLVVELLAPGLAEPDLAVRCLRTSALTVLLLGVAGYLMAALRVQGAFRLTQSVYVLYNVGILACVFALGRGLGVYSAALGLAVGGLLMVLVQVPVFLRGLPLLRPRVDLASLALFLPFVPIAAYTLTRQSQTFVERWLGSYLDAGSISHLNYAQKVAQVPVLLSVTAAAVAFPALARAAGRGDVGALGRAMTRDLRVVLLLVAPATAALVALAPQAVGLLFERGAFDASDTADTAGIMRLYALGLIGQAVTTVGVLAAYSGARPTWRPAVAGLACLAVTLAVDVPLALLLGTRGLAIGNAAGITVLALLVVRRLSRDVAPLDARVLRLHLVRCLVAAAVATAAGYLVAGVAPGPELAVLLLGGLAVVAAFAAVCALLGVQEVRDLGRPVRTAVGRLLSGPVPFATMYHSVGDPHDDPHVVVVSPARLRRQLRLLRALGLRGVSLRELYAAQDAGAGAGLVGLSFDDGYRDFLTEAVPLLEEHGCTATVFMVVGGLGGSNAWDTGPERPLMTAEELREVARRGHEVASHGMTHADVRGLPAEALAREAVESRGALEALLGEPVTGFCYPYGHTDPAALAAVEAAGYAYGAGVGQPATRSRYDTPRAFVGEADGLVRLVAKLVVFRLAVRRQR